MKKKAQKFSFVMMILNLLFGITMTIVVAVTVGRGVSLTNSHYGSGSGGGGWVVAVLFGGFIGTLFVTAVWWSVLEHFRNIERAIDQKVRSDLKKESLPDSTYSYLPKFLEDALNQPKMPYPPQQAYPQYQQPPIPPQAPQYAQPPVPPVVNPNPPVPPVANAQPPVANAQPPVAKPQPPVQEQPPIIPEASDWFCPKCGTKNGTGSLFCSNCGTKK